MDTTTLLFALALGNLALCAALFFAGPGAAAAPVAPGWARARQCQALAWLLLYLGAAGAMPGLYAIPLGYALLFAGVAFEAGALWEAAGYARWRRAMLPLLGVALVLFPFGWLADPAGRGAAPASLIAGGLYLSGAAALGAGWGAGSRLRRVLAVAIALLALALAVTGAAGVTDAELLPAAAAGVLYALMLASGFGFLLLSREQLQQELARLEVIDPLTGVPNRRGFFNALAPWMALARRPGVPAALLVLDPDQFKHVNDSYGHPAGDTVLRALAATCRQQLRDSDQLGRLAGAELAILLPRTGLDEALVVAERIRAAIEAAPVKTERAMVKLSASFGATVLRADDTTVSLFQRADQALQAARLAGGNRVAPAPPAVLAS